MSKVKIALFAVGIGMGMASSMSAATSCRDLLRMCEWDGIASACTAYMRFCGDIP